MTQARLLELALAGLQQELNELNMMMKTPPATPPQAPVATSPTPRKPGRPKTNPETTTGKRKRILTPEARARIAEAQRRRWAKTTTNANDSNANNFGSAEA